MSALYIVFEGIDGSGKTTQAKRLYDRFKAGGQDARRWVEPSTYGGVGAEIRRRIAEGPLLESWEAFGLFVADRRATLDELTLNIERGAVVVQDRSYFSTAVYQGGSYCTPPWQFIVTYHESWMPKPDLVILLDLDAEIACKRIEARGLPTSFEGKTGLVEARARYKQVLTETIPEALVILDAAKPLDALEDLIWNLAVRRLTQKNIEAATRGA